MENKKYEDYHVLDENEEKVIDVEIIEETSNQNIQEENIQEENIQNEEQKHEPLSLEKMTQESDIQQNQVSIVANNKSSRKYESVLTEDIEETDIKEDSKGFQNEYSKINYSHTTEGYKTKIDNSSEPQDTEETQEDYKDTSFSKYVEKEKKKERGFLVKWSLRLIKLILFIMLLPVIGIVGGGVIGVIGVISGGILACIGGGLFTIALTCFVATQVNTMIVALGISAGIAAISFGGIVLIIFMAVIKGIVNVVKRNRSDKENKEVR